MASHPIDQGRLWASGLSLHGLFDAPSPYCDGRLGSGGSAPAFETNTVVVASGSYAAGIVSSGTVTVDRPLLHGSGVSLLGLCLSRC